jgi:putative peptidoglycan binding protein
MRTFLALICTLALACAAGGAQDKNKSKKSAPKKTQAQSSQHTLATAKPSKAAPKHYAAASTPKYYQKTKGRQQANSQIYQPSSKLKRGKGSQQIAVQNAQAAGGGWQKAKGSQQTVAAGKYTSSATYSKKTKQWGKTYNAQHFNLASKTRPTKFAPVTFQQNRRIQGSQYWQGKNYWAFRNYRPAWHDRIWWGNHYNRIVFVYGGWYYWNAGWWYPAWGYTPNAYYAYDGPIYGYNGLPPDQVTANVQAALQQQGYYQGEVDGLLGPLTRAAIAAYQRDHGLYMTSAIDRPTLASLGMT